MSDEDERSPDVTMEHAAAVLEKYKDALMAKANVQGTAVGLGMDDDEYTSEIVIVVMVDKKLPESALEPEDIIPPELEGVTVNVREMGIFSAQ